MVSSSHTKECDGTLRALMQSTSTSSQRCCHWAMCLQSVLSAGLCAAASGKSVLAEASTGGEEAVEDQTRIIASEYGFSEDAVQRFLLAFNQDETLAHQKMRISYVRPAPCARPLTPIPAPPPPLIPHQIPQCLNLPVCSVNIGNIQLFLVVNQLRESLFVHDEHALQPMHRRSLIGCPHA